MSTLIDLRASGEIELFEPELGFRQQPLRLIYLRPGVFEWVERNLADLESDHATEISPIEQLDEILNAFCAGERLQFDRQLKPLHHRIHGVWELKTVDLRLFGWFPKVDVFVWTDINRATAIKQHDLYQGYIGNAVRFRDRLDLDPPKFILGDNPDAVATNIS